MTSTNVKELIDGKIAGKKVMVFSKSTCFYCGEAKRVLKDPDYKLTKEDMEIMEIDRHPAISQIQDYLKRLTKGRSVPRVFINGKFIGGGSDTVTMHKNGKLKKKLDESKKGEAS